MNPAQIVAGAALVMYILQSRGLAPDVAREIVQGWVTRMRRQWHRRLRSQMEFSLERDRFYGPGY